MLQNYPLNAKNTLGINSTAQWFAEPTSIQELAELLELADKEHKPIRVIGGGSNIVLEQFVEGLVIELGMRKISILSETESALIVRAEAGVNWHELVMWSVKNHWFGLENLALIPGSVGAAPIQNIGAYGVELQSVVDCVHFVDRETKQQQSLNNAACEFSYRNSIFKQALKDRAIITAVDFRLSKLAKPMLNYPALADELISKENLSAEDIAKAVIAIRQRKLPDPKDIPNAGSFFKNPIVTQEHFQALIAEFPQMVAYPHDNNSMKLAAGWLIDHIGIKGECINGVGMHHAQALVLVNPGHCSGHEVLEYANSVCQRVYDCYQVKLEIEPRVYINDATLSI